jgi:hypothetical protein
MVVKNHILEIQNIELQMREKAKEQLRERMMVEVGKNSHVQGFLPKIEIAKWPSVDERQLFTPSTKAPMVSCHMYISEAYTHTHTHIYIYTPTHPHTCTCIQTRARAHTHTSTDIPCFPQTGTLVPGYGAEITSSRVFQLGSRYVYVCMYVCIYENACMCMYI